MFEYSIVCCARWEAPYIGEWIRYYDKLGFDRIYIYCNDEDPELLQAEVGRVPKSHPDLVEFVHFRGQGQQRAMYLDALQKVRREAAWVAFLDVDEFLFLPECQNIKSFMLDRQASVDSIHFHWLNFGNSGFVKRPSGNVLPKYTHRAARLHQNTKHLSRVSLLDEDRIAASHHPFWHGLFDPAWSDLRRSSVLGDDMGELVVDLPTRLQAYIDDPARLSLILQTAVINHYMIKSEEDFNIRAARGLKGEFSGQSMWRDQYNSGNYKSILAAMNSVEDTRMRDFARACGWDEAPGQASGAFEDRPGSKCRPTGRRAAGRPVPPYAMDGRIGPR